MAEGTDWAKEMRVLDVEDLVREARSKGTVGAYQALSQPLIGRRSNRYAFAREHLGLPDHLTFALEKEIEQSEEEATEQASEEEASSSLRPTSCSPVVTAWAPRTRSRCRSWAALGAGSAHVRFGSGEVALGRRDVVRVHTQNQPPHGQRCRISQSFPAAADGLPPAGSARSLDRDHKKRI